MNNCPPNCALCLNDELDELEVDPEEEWEIDDYELEEEDEI